MAKNPEICGLLDLLTLDMLDLVEQQVQCMVNIEKQKSEGDILLAKARYIQGVASVSSAQLPTESTANFQALATVSTTTTTNDDGLLSGQTFSIEKHPINRDEGYVNPLNWFGVLVPRCLQMARDSFEKAVELVVESANVQHELRNCIGYLGALRKMKYDVETIG